MPKSIPIQLLNALGQPGKSTCFLIKIRSMLTDAIYAFTTLDAAIRFNDGQDNLLYRAYNILNPQNIQASWNLDDVDNTELHGWFDNAVAQALTAGLLGNAEITIYRVAYNHLEYGAEIIGFGLVGKAEFSANKQGSRKLEFLGLSSMLLTKVNPVWSITCRNDFGDHRCKMPYVWHVATVGEVFNNLISFRAEGLAQPDDYFNFGVVRFVDGNNANVEMEVEDWDADGFVKLSFVTPYAIAEGTQLMFRQDCDKFDTTCIDTYNNILNFNGEHLIPTQDQSLMVPGAYIKSNNAL